MWESARRRREAPATNKMAPGLTVWLALAVALHTTTNTIAWKQIKRQNQPSSCSAKSDVVFLLDSSDAVGQDNYQKELDFVRDTVNRLDVGPQRVQVGLATFGATAQSVFNLNRYQTGQDVIQALRSAPMVGGTANIQEAIRFTTENMFTPQAGVGSQTSHIVVLVTNGHSPNADLTILQGQTAQNNDIQMYAVGVGASVDERELKGVASDPDTRYYYHADTFEAMSGLDDILGPKICNEVPKDPAFLPAPTGCLQKADVVFLLDSSSSIGKDNFHKLEDFVKDVVQDLAVSPDGVHVALMQYSTYPSLEFPLGMHTTRYEALKAVDGVSYMGGGGNTADALDYMRRLVFSQNSDARPGVPRIGIVITDGSSPNSADVAVQANNARLDNIGLISVGVGPDQNTAELQAIADDPDSEHMFSVRNYDDLPTITQQLINAACQVQATSAPMATGPSGTLPPDPCQDKLNCANYADDVCTLYVEWSKVNCQRKCGFCQPLYTPPPPKCEDTIPNCASYGVASCSGTYVGWAQQQCKRYCGYCGVDTVSLGYYGSCFYKDKTYGTGETWFDGCDYECTCEDGNTGKYRCFNRCPVYHDLPPGCTLVKDPSDCCLQPRCNFRQQVATTQGSTIGHVKGVNTCEYKGSQYYQGQVWQDGCDYQCTCTDANTGHWECHDLCPQYPNLPSYCRLEKMAGSCCAKPNCEFNLQVGTFTGVGSVSGNGIDSPPPTLPPCVDNIDNCPMYGKPACTQYRNWALTNCRKFCEYCDVGRVPGPEDVCLYDGHQYHQGETWSPSCNMRCTCERATQGYYRCDDLCPTYTNIPPTCQVVKPAGQCCPTLQCGSGTFISSTTNLNTIGNGGNIFTGQSYVPPTLLTGITAAPGTGDTSFQAPSIPGCLYKGQVYIQSQTWNDGCDLSCECQDASTGRYKCRARCPQYAAVPSGCQMVVDESDTCCLKPYCTGPEAAHYIPIPVYGQFQSQSQVAQPPNPAERYTSTSNVYTGSGPVSQATVVHQGYTTVPPPSSGPGSAGGLGYCSYKGHQYQPNERWEDGCDYNCICDDASIGHYTCVDKCVVYQVNALYCHLVTDPLNPCCQIPNCTWTAPYGQVTGLAAIEPTTVAHQSTQPPTPGFAFCVYNGTHYDKNQIWYHGCDFKCTCENPETNNYRCVSRCPEYENLAPECTFEPDPDDPGCCSVPRCPTPAPNLNVPNPTQGVITVVPGIVTGDNFPPGVTGGPNNHVCEYNGQQYRQGERWEDGCTYDCVCEDEITGKYKCTQKCSRYDYVPPNCRLVTDFTNPCCQTVKCEPTTTTTPAPTDHPQPHVSTTTLAPTFCVYKGVNYRQDEVWKDGCDKTCRCDNSDTGVYSCTERCLSYDDLPPECKLVTDPQDQCCLVPQCEIPTALPFITPIPNPGATTAVPLPGQTVNPDKTITTTPVPRLNPTPTAVPGKVTGFAAHPTPTIGPNGETPAPVPMTYCEYKGTQYQQGDVWQDGCFFNCECVNALQGKYECTERCPRYTNLPPECRMVKNPADPCCETPECGPPSTTPPTTTPVPGLVSTVTPPANPQNTGPTQSPTIPTTVQPSTTPTDVCIYKGRAYSQGQQWYDGCDYKCVCENGVQGLYTCNDRCASYQSGLPDYCTLVQDPSDPFCCKIPECNPPPSYANVTGSYTLPTPPLAVISGGSATPVPTPPSGTQTPTVGVTYVPRPGETTTAPPTQAPTLPPNVCVYNGRPYQQGQTWRDGCDYNCRCEDGMRGYYVCTEVCPKNPPSLPDNCHLVRDVNNPCCQIPICEPTTTPQPPTPAPTGPNGQPVTISTAVPPTGPNGVLLTNPPTPGSTVTPEPPSFCVYNGVQFKQGQTWDDGCDLKCICEDSSTGYYRCNSRCPRYDHVPAGCVLVLDPRDSCCQVPLCEPIKSTTTPLPSPTGPTLYPPTAPPPGQTTTTPVPELIPTAIPGKVEGVGVTPTPGPAGLIPNPDNPFVTQAPTMAPGCLYKGVVHTVAEGTWSDGCLYDCVCLDDMSGRYSCTEKCPLYPSLPPNCHLVNDPADPCCKKPQCIENPMVVPTTPMVSPTGTTLTPPPFTQPPQYTPVPVLREVCVMNGKTYTQGQRWDDGCERICVCEDGKTGFYRCTDRCAKYDNVPPGCTMVADPNDPQCCEIPECAPTPNPQYPNPTAGPTQLVTGPVGKVTGLAPAPTPTPKPGETPPTSAPGCFYKGMLYRQNQQWQDGCDYVCICLDDMTGAYSCTQRCPPIGQVLTRCRVEPDPNDFCCVRQVCDYSEPVPTPGLPPVSSTTPPPLPPGQTYPPTTPPPMTANPPPTTPPPVCVYNGVPYGQGVTWKEGCSRTCRCEDGMNNIYTCFDRCPTYELKPGCQLVTDPTDPCCQVPQCAVLVAPSTTTPPPMTPYPNGTMPDYTPSKAPGLAPVPEPSPVPQGIPGILTGTLPTPTGYCEYKGGRYTTGQSWDDGCDYVCLCVDQNTGQYRCTERCPPYPNVPPYCVMVRDPSDQCCEKPYCPGLQPPTTPPTTLPPTTPSPSGQTPPQLASGPTPPPGSTFPPASTTSPPPTPAPFTLFPNFGGSIPPPTGDYNPVPRDVCIMNGKSYTQGQEWYDGCERICVCEDGKTGFYSCRERCPTYTNIAPDCIMAPDPKDPICCKAPQCAPPADMNTPPKGVLGQIEGNGLPPVPTPSPGAPTEPPPQPVCMYKGNAYRTGQHWQDGCDLDCVCVDDMSGQYRCTDICQRYPNLPSYCVLVYDPTNPCCEKPLCGDNRPPPTTTPAPTQPNGDTYPPPTGPTPTTVSPNAFCVYNGVPYKQGQSWNVGCDKVCRCEDAMTRQVTCTDRCGSFPAVRDGCVLKTDPQDSCCQILDCPPQIDPDTQLLVPPLPPIKTGESVPRPSGIPTYLNGGTPTCVYNGVAYNQGQMWDDGCTYTCVCVDAESGKYMCTEKCPRFDNLPATCTLVQDNQNPCCKVAYCPDMKTPTSTTSQPGVTTPQGQTPGTMPPTPAPPGVCVYGNNYYKQGQMWYDGCLKRCVCEDTDRNFYRCDERCTKYENVPVECRLVPDPADPQCCQIPECPLEPTKGPTAGYVRPDVTPPVGLIEGSAPVPTPTPTQNPGDTTPIPLPATGCYYKNVVYSQGQSWDDGCDYVCICEDEMTGAYRCTDKCPPQSNTLPDASRCRLVQDPTNPCCPVPYCDFEPAHPQPVFPTPMPQPSTTGPGGELNYWTPPPESGTKPPGFCVYQGVYYQQGDEWTVGCVSKCRCEDVENGYYSCFERCKSYDNLPSYCTLKADPADPCCVIPDCNQYPAPDLLTTIGPNGETQPTPTVMLAPVSPASFTGTGGNNPVGLNSGTPFLGSNRNVCIYKGVAYTQGQLWDDGCDFKCECIDSVRGQYRCSERCEAYYFLPDGCSYVPDPNDACCKLVSCNGQPVVTGTPTTPPPTPGVITLSQARCVYKDGKQYSTGDTWADGCQLTCKCDDASNNKYTCTERCPVFSSIPDYCHLVHDNVDHCCMVAECQGRLTALVGSETPTLSPFLPPNVTDIVPLGTHTVISGRSPLTPGYSGPPFTGGRYACVYNNQAYQQGDSWDDGCDYVCTCLDAVAGDYQCTSKCPRMPPLPQYCKKVDIPGQCCPSISCEVPGEGTYVPTPELTAQNVPTPPPTTDPAHGGGHAHTTTPNPQIIVPVLTTTSGGAHLPGGGAAVPPNTITGSLYGKCITDDLKMYNPGEKWIQNCDYECECLDGRTGYYSCSQLCTAYSNIPSECTLVKEGCCDKPLCTKPDGTTVDLVQHPEELLVFPILATKTGGYTGFRPGFLAMQGPTLYGSSKPGCTYKGVDYDEGAEWDDGCEFHCKCEDGVSRQFLCQPKCQRYQNIPSTCRVFKDPQQCCDLLDCTSMSTTTQNPACQDPLDNCADYGKEACQEPYLSWAKRNCPCYCGFPSEVTTTPTPTCQDKLDNCPDYTTDACTGPYEPWARENCPNFCGYCPSNPPATTENPLLAQCHDLLPDCASYGSYSCNPPYTEWARKNCNHTCGFCSRVIGQSVGGFSGNTSGIEGVVNSGGHSEIGGYSQPGWVTLLKGVRGVPHDDLFRLWASSETRNANNSEAMRPNTDFLGHYKPEISNYWDQCNFDQVKVAVWNNGEEKAYIIFDARGTNKMSWFDQSRIISSSYSDLKTASTNFFSMQGDPALGREFYINKDSNGCAGSGWIMVSTQSTCFYERGSKPTFYYASGNTAGSLASRLEGDVFMISGHGGSCTGMNTTQGKPVCNYKGTDYLQGQTWQDGCEKNCTCRDANLGYYQCDDLCHQYTSALPEGCRLTKAPGACCETLECNTGSRAGCYYKGHYYRQSEEWVDGCDYRCTCEQEQTGFYTCRTRCVTWNLPSVCYLATPEEGKCCPKPVCPAGFVITYPPGYTEE